MARFTHETVGSALNNSRPSGGIFCAKARGGCENCEVDNAMALDALSLGIDYGASSSSTSSSSSSSLALDGLSVFASFPVQGEEGEFDVICRNLGLSPEDFAVPMDTWRSSKARDLTPRLRLQSALLDFDGDGDANDESPRDGGGLAAGVDSIELESGISILNGSISYGSGGLEDRGRVKSCRTRFKHRTAGSALNDSRPSVDVFCAKARGNCENCETDSAGRGIGGLRPPVLSLPPLMVRLPVVDDDWSTWDLLKLLGPQEGSGGDEDSPVRPF